MTESNPMLAPSVADWQRLTPDDLAILQAIGERTSLLARQWIKEGRLKFHGGNIIEPHPQNVAMDWGVVHLQKGINLHAYYFAPADVFMREFVTLQSVIDRTICRVPDSVRWVYQSPQHKPGAFPAVFRNGIIRDPK